MRAKAKHIPIYVFVYKTIIDMLPVWLKSVLGIDTILLGLGLPDDNTHSPNEKFNLDDFQHGIETVAYLLAEVAAAGES